MFWGLQLESNLRYSQQVPEGFRITKATLNPESAPAAVKSSQDATSKLVQVFVEQDGSDYAIATLKHGETYDCSMDLRFAEGEDICFHLKGEGIVFLTGHNLYPDGNDDKCFYPSSKAQDLSSSDEDLDVDDDDDDDDDVDDVDEESDDDIAENADDTEESSDSDGPQIEDITELTSSKSKFNSNRASNGIGAAAKKHATASGARRLDAGNDHDDDDDDDDDDEDFDESGGDFDEEHEVGSDESHDDEDDDDDDEDDDDDDDEEEQQQQKKTKMVTGLKRTELAAQLKPKTPEPKKAKLQNGAHSATPRANGDAKRGAAEATKALQGSKKAAVTAAAVTKANDSVKELVVEDVRVGSGPVAKKGKNVHVYYTGTLLNGKKFDSLVTGKPFQFRLGTASVIKGWDKGIEGMKVGGKRRLVIPSNMAYGKHAMGPIPAHSALRFEVELKAVSG